MIKCSESPKFTKTSLAAAITLKLKKGSFYREARLNCLNLLLSYDSGCVGRCAYCGLANNRVISPEENTFIRVKWPTYDVDEILQRAKRDEDKLKRVCVAMVTHPQALADCNEIISRFKHNTSLLISALVTPTMIKNKRQIKQLKESGADSLGIAVDTATGELFGKLRGSGVEGPHSWRHYWQVIKDAVAVFGPGNVSVHLIVGLGETEKEMVETIHRVNRQKAVPHLFAFFPEKGSALGTLSQPPIGQYRRIQLARHLIVSRLISPQQMQFNEDGKIVDYGTDIKSAVETGLPFMTSGCPDAQGETACNRPYGNERPGELLYNYPFRPNNDDVKLIKSQLWQGLKEEQYQSW